MVSDAPLSKVAVDIKASLEKVDDHYTRSRAIYSHNTHKDQMTVLYGGKKKLGRDIFIST